MARNTKQQQQEHTFRLYLFKEKGQQEGEYATLSDSDISRLLHTDFRYAEGDEIKTESVETFADELQQEYGKLREAEAFFSAKRGGLSRKVEGIVASCITEAKDGKKVLDVDRYNRLVAVVNFRNRWGNESDFKGQIPDDELKNVVGAPRNWTQYTSTFRRLWNDYRLTLGDSGEYKTPAGKMKTRTVANYTAAKSVLDAQNREQEAAKGSKGKGEGEQHRVSPEAPVNIPTSEPEQAATIKAMQETVSHLWNLFKQFPEDTRREMVNEAREMLKGFDVKLSEQVATPEQQAEGEQDQPTEGPAHNAAEG